MLDRGAPSLLSLEAKVQKSERPFQHVYAVICTRPIYYVEVGHRKVTTGSFE